MQEKRLNLLNDINVLGSLLLVIMLVFAAYFHNSVLYYSIVVVSLLFIRKPEVIFPVFFIATMSDTFFAIRVGLSVGRLLSIIMIASCLIRWRISKISVKSKTFSLALIIIAFTILSALLGYDGGWGIIVIMLMNLAVFFLFSRLTDIDLTKLLTILSIAAFLLLIMMFLKARSDGAFMFDVRYDADEEVNSNRLAMMAAQSGAILMGYVFFGDNRRIRISSLLRILYIPGVISAVYIILATGSRSGLLGLLGALFICVLLIVVKRKTKRNNLLIVLVIVSFGITAVAISRMDNKIMDRYTIENVESNGGAGRATHAEIVLDIFQDHLLFGSGIGIRNMQALMGITGRHGDVAHNIIIDPLTQMGIVGFSLYLLLIVPVFKKGIRITRNSCVFYYIAIMPFIAALVNGIGEVVFYEKLFWNDMALVVFAYNNLRSDDLMVMS